MILNRNFKIRLALILAFLFLFITYQYSGLKNYLVANNITYRVQISAAYERPIPVDLLVKKFSIEESVREDYHRGWYKYSVGSFPEYYDARKLRDKLISENKAYGAFVVLIKDDIRMDAMDTVPAQNTPTLQSNQKVSYKIQIRASNQQLVISELKAQLGLAEDIAEEFDNKWYKYTIGNFENYDDVKNLFYRIKNIDKINDAFIVTYYGNRRVGYYADKTEKNKKLNASKPKITETKQQTYKPEKIVRKIQVKEKPVVVEKINKQPEVVIISDNNVKVSKFNVVLFHINPERLRKTTKKPIQNIEDQNSDLTSERANYQETQNYDTVQNIETEENISKTREVVNPTSTSSQYYYNENDTLNRDYKYKNRSLFGRFVDNVRLNFKKSFFIWLLIMLIFYFLLNLILVTTIVFISRVRKIRKERKIQKIEEDFQLLLAEFLFDTNNEKEAYNKLRNTSGEFKRNILIDELMKLSVDLSGEVLEKLKILYFNMELDKDSANKLKNRKWYVKVKGCRELTRMKAYNAKSDIEVFLNSKNDILRAEAQMALIELSEENPYYFLEKLTEKFLPWEQLNVHVMMQRNSYEIPDFSKWLMVENETVVLFAIEMIRVYRQIMNAPKIIKFFKHPNPGLREAAIIAAGELGYVEVVPEMIKIYNDVEEEYQVLILRSMQRLADDANKDFLRGIIESNASQHIKLDAAKAMFALGIKGQIELKRYSQTDDAELNAIIKHVFDERI